MNPLPHHYVTWDESDVSLSSFLRYQVYCRIVAEPENAWTKIARINDRCRTNSRKKTVLPTR